MTREVPDLLTGMATTRTIRRIASDPIPDDDLSTILWHATRAPSGANRLPCLVRYREPHTGEGASVYPACQNLLLAARALGHGGVLTGWHAMVEDELRAVVGIPDEVVIAATITLGRPLGRRHGRHALRRATPRPRALDGRSVGSTR